MLARYLGCACAGLIGTLLALCISMAAAFGQTYLIEPDVLTAQTRTGSLWQQVQCQPQPSCDVAAITRYLLPVQALTDSTAAVAVPAGANTAALAVNVATSGVAAFTPAEQAAVTALTNDTRLPWMVSQAAFQSRLTAANANAINLLTGASAISPLGTAWNAVKAAAVVNLEALAVSNLMAAMINSGIITAPQALVIITPVAVAAVGN